MDRRFAVLLVTAFLPFAAAGQSSSDYLQRFSGAWGWRRYGEAESGWFAAARLLSVGADLWRQPRLARRHLSAALPLLPVGRYRCNAALRSGDEQLFGTYVINDGFPAALVGTEVANTLTLNVRWAKPVNGHRDAIIRIVNDGGLFTLTTTDPIGVGGQPVVTSDLSFTRSPN